MGPLGISIKEYPECSAIINPSGYTVFTDLPAGKITVTMTSHFYHVENRTISLPLDPHEGLLVTVALTPRWFYPFPAETTLITGKVTDPDQPLRAAVVKLFEGVETKTDQGRDGMEHGEDDGHAGKFVLRIRGLTEERILIKGGKRFIKAKAEDHESAFQLRVTCSGYRDQVVMLRDLAEGEHLHLKHPISLRRL
jgi:hypothetical protein